VLDFEVIGSTREQGAVLANQLRAELLKTGRFTLVNRAQLDKILDELALQQQLCTQKECAAALGIARASVCARVRALEQEQREITAGLGDPAMYRGVPEQMRQMQARFAEIEEQLMQALARWEALEAKR